MKSKSTALVVSKGTAAASAATKRAEALLELIARRKARIAEDFYDIGEALREILDKKLYVALGHRSFGELLEKRAVMGRTQASKLVSIARAMPRKEALDLGPEKAYALLQYTRATPEGDSVASVLAEGVRTKGRRRSVAAVSSRAVATEAKALRDKGRKVSEAERDGRRAARAAQASLRAHGFEVRVEAEATGNVWSARIHVGVDDLDALVRAATRAVK